MLLSENPRIEFTNEDNIELMARYPDKHFELAIVDPPYGLGNRLSDGGGKLKNTPMAELYRNKDWDVLPTKSYWDNLFSVSKNQVVFGANYFIEHLHNSRGIISWDKKQDMPTLSAWELVWTSYDKPSKIYKQSSMDLDRFHPTQKPVGLYCFCLNFCKIKEGDTILDTHVGGGSIMIACWELGFDFVGCELDKDYYNAAVKRFKEHVQAHPKLFTPKQLENKQLTID